MYVVRAGRVFYAIALIVFAIQQFIYADFRPVLFPPWQTSLPLLPLWAYAFGMALLIAAAGIISGKYSRDIFLVFGVVFLALVCFAHVPYQLISNPTSPIILASGVMHLKNLRLRAERL